MNGSSSWTSKRPGYSSSMARITAVADARCPAPWSEKGKRMRGASSPLRSGLGPEGTDRLGLLGEPGHGESVGRAFLEHCLARPGLVLDRHCLRGDGVTLQALTGAAADLDRRCTVEQEEVSPKIELPG